MLIYTRHDPRFFDHRLYKGGDGGMREMRADEQRRQREVQQAVDAINVRFGHGARGGVAPTREEFTQVPEAGIVMGPEGVTFVEHKDPVFDEAGFNAAQARFSAGTVDADRNKVAREAMYGDISGAVRDTAMRDLDRQYAQASQRNKFGLARSGLMGGSVDAESGGELRTIYGEGRLKATQAGQQAGADLRVSDERTRQNLIQLAQSGLETGTAASMAASQMGAAADLAKSQAAGASVGRLFDDMAQAYVNNQVTRARYPAAGTPQQQPSTYGYGGFSPSRYVGNVQR